ncbi:Glycosyltransferase [Mucinivorans hirudinis]|uniref:Glycosyltransferase n=1 Tax=Mucinivorans hirudinis TaxID=1433126 RepID=A0A060RAY6_9BACT|nr:Glycosyltransferase [Mucinivorans hirudinis]
MVTIFTPTYNRAYILPKLYESLRMQTNSNFEWIVVDDGSTDNTAELISKWIEDGEISIQFIRKSNGGKHRAINCGLSKARGYLFFIVDSDDYLTTDAVESIINEWAIIGNSEEFAGLCFRKINYATTKMLGNNFPAYPREATSLTIAYKWKITQDKAEVFVTEHLRKYPFPEIEGELFFTEAYVWNKIALSNRALLRCVNKGIYLCDYLEDGLTSNFIALLRSNPRGLSIYYKSLLRLPLLWRSPVTVAKTLVRLFQCYYFRILK